MKQIKCENCGANIDGNICPYCNTKYSSEKEMQESTLQKSNTITTKINNSGRPKIKVGLAIFLFILYWPIGLIYVLDKAHKQKKWDIEQNKKD